VRVQGIKGQAENVGNKKRARDSRKTFAVAHLRGAPRIKGRKLTLHITIAMLPFVALLAISADSCGRSDKNNVLALNCPAGMTPTVSLVNNQNPQCPNTVEAFLNDPTTVYSPTAFTLTLDSDGCVGTVHCVASTTTTKTTTTAAATVTATTVTTKTTTTTVATVTATTVTTKTATTVTTTVTTVTTVTPGENNNNNDDAAGGGDDDAGGGDDDAGGMGRARRGTDTGPTCTSYTSLAVTAAGNANDKTIVFTGRVSISKGDQLYLRTSTQTQIVTVVTVTSDGGRRRRRQAVTTTVTVNNELQFGVDAATVMAIIPATKTKHHAKKPKEKKNGWMYAVVVVIVFCLACAIAYLLSKRDGSSDDGGSIDYSLLVGRKN